jgi:hypothetical protein
MDHDHTDNSLGLMRNNTQLTFSNQVALGKRFPLRANKTVTITHNIM